MPRVIIFYIDALIESTTDRLMAEVVIPTILITKHRANSQTLQKRIREVLSTPNNSLFQNLPPEILAANLDIDYNALLDVYLFMAEKYTRMRPYVEYVLKSLKSNGHKIIVYTYSDPTWDQIKLTAAGLEKFVDQIINIPLEDLSENATIYTLLDILIKRKILNNESNALLVTTDIRDYIVARELNIEAYLLGYNEGIATRDLLLDLRDILNVL